MLAVGFPTYVPPTSPVVLQLITQVSLSLTLMGFTICALEHVQIETPNGVAVV
jgi:hypothetical protein